MIKRIILTLFVFICFVTCLFAFDERDQELLFTVTIPEDYGVFKPIDALSLDKFVFEIDDPDILLTSDNLDIGTMFDNTGSFDFTLLYYGNQEMQYDARIVVNTGMGWYMEKNNEFYSIPISVTYSEPSDIGEGITVDKYEVNDGVGVHIPATGPRRGDSVLTVSLEWEDDFDAPAGEYQASIGIAVEAI